MSLNHSMTAAPCWPPSAVWPSPPAATPALTGTFTGACSSAPAGCASSWSSPATANAVLNGLADRKDLITLSFAVTYWD